jgi:hypothetical protein
MMPYKIRQGEGQARLFYAVLVLLHQRFHDRFLERGHERLSAAA